MRALAITGIVTAALMPSIISGSLMRATPPSRRMSEGTRSSAMTATAPASSAIFACSGSTTSMITPPLSISASPRLTRVVPVSWAGCEGVMQPIVPSALRNPEAGSGAGSEAGGPAGHGQGDPRPARREGDGLASRVGVGGDGVERRLVPPAGHQPAGGQDPHLALAHELGLGD